MYSWTTYDSPLGTITLGSDGVSLTGIWFDGQKHFANTAPKDGIRQDSLPLFIRTIRWLDQYFAAEMPNPAELPLKPEGSEFRQLVWEALRKIPYGQVVTYGDIASELHKDENASRAIGGAVGHNPISIVIPCHRVIGSDGNLTGYAGGISRKISLLKLEGIDTSTLNVPAKGTPT